MKDFKTIYKAIVQPRSYHVIQYAILRGLAHADERITATQLIDRYIHKAFTPIRRKTRLENGHEPNQALIDAISWARSFAADPRNRFGKPQALLGVKPDDIFETEEEAAAYKAQITRLWDKVFVPINVRYTRQYVYIFVRQDISPEYQLVQAAHVAAMMGHRQGQAGRLAEHFDQLYFTVIGVPTELALMKAEEELKQRGVTAYVFREPDIGNQITAVASSPIIMNDRKGLLAYKRLVFKEA